MPHSLADVLVSVMPMPHHGLWDADRRLVMLRDDLDPVAKRCTLAHEVVHAARGIPRHGMPPLVGVIDEATAEVAAARLLICANDLITVALSGATLPEAAAHLHVDLQMLKARLRGLDPLEQAFIAAAVAA